MRPTIAAIVIATSDEASPERRLHPLRRQHRPPDEVFLIQSDPGRDLREKTSRLWRAPDILARDAGPHAAHVLAGLSTRCDYLAVLEAGQQWFPWTFQVLETAIAAADHPAVVFGRSFDYLQPSDLQLVPQEEMTLQIFCMGSHRSQLKQDYPRCRPLLFHREAFLRNVTRERELQDAYQSAAQGTQRAALVEAPFMVAEPLATPGTSTELPEGLADLNFDLRGLERTHRRLME